MSRVCAGLLALSLFAGAAATAEDLAARRVSGTITEMQGTSLTLRTRVGLAAVDAAPAIAAERASVLLQGEPVTVQGRTGADGHLVAAIITRAKPDPDLWPADR